MNKNWIITVVVILLIIIGIAVWYKAAKNPPANQNSGQTASTNPTTWNVQAGASNPDHSVVTSKFYPQTIYVNEGDTITWKSVGDAHTVSFLSGMKAPSPLASESATPAGGNTYSDTGFFNSGIIAPDGSDEGPHSYSLTFTKPGTYQYNCLLHQGNPGMVGTVVVRAKGTAYPETQNQYDAQTQTDSQKDLSDGQNIVNTVKPTIKPNSDGTKNYHVSAGEGNMVASSMRFLPGDLTIKVGDTITWVNNDPMMPHTVSIAGPDGKFPEFPEPDAVTPTTNTTFDGSKFTNSGLMLPKGAPDSKPYTLKFTKAGTYQYECLLHDELGMKGKITVQP